jgi:hypothetical protein
MLRPSNSFALVGLASVVLSACGQKDVVEIFEGIGSAPKVCPSSVQLDSSQPEVIQFRPFVENRGVKDNTTDFNLNMVVTRTREGQSIGAARGYVFSGAAMTIPGTGGVSGVTAGPEVELTTIIFQAPPRTFSYDPEVTYGVTLTFKSSNESLDAISADCHQLAASFKGGQRL